MYVKPIVYTGFRFFVYKNRNIKAGMQVTSVLMVGILAAEAISSNTSLVILYFLIMKIVIRR